MTYTIPKKKNVDQLIILNEEVKSFTDMQRLRRMKNLTFPTLTALF
jgi:hypothetical protein